MKLVYNPRLFGITGIEGSTYLGSPLYFHDSSSLNPFILSSSEYFTTIDNSTWISRDSEKNLIFSDPSAGTHSLSRLLEIGVSQAYVDGSLNVRVLRTVFDASILSLTNVNTSQDASIVALRTKDTNIDTSLNAIWVSQSTQDASIVALRTKDTNIDTSLNAIWASQASQDASILSNFMVRIDNNEPNGHVTPDDVSVYFINSTRTLSIAPFGSEFTYYSDGLRYVKTTQETIQIDASEGTHFIYWDGSILSKTRTFFNGIITAKAIIAIVYWDASNNKQLYFGREYYHSTKMDGNTHSYAHNTLGFALQSGGELGNILTDQTGNLDTHIEFSNAVTICWDEDARFNLPARLSTAIIPKYFREGNDASLIWRNEETTSFAVTTRGTGRAAYNQLNGSIWQLTECTNLDFVLTHVAATNDTDRPFIAFIGQNQYPTVGTARDGAEIEINNLILEGLPFVEFKFLGTIISQTANGYGNSVKSRIRSTNDGDDYIDLRGSVLGRSGSSSIITDHNALAGLQGGAPNEYFHHTASQASDWVGKAYVDGSLATRDSSITLLFTRTSSQDVSIGNIYSRLSTIDASITWLDASITTLFYQNISQDASIVALRTKDTNIDTSLNAIWVSQSTQDASIVVLRTKDTNIDTSLNAIWVSQSTQDASIVDIRNVNTSQDASIVDIRNVNTSQDASIVALRTKDFYLGQDTLGGIVFYIYDGSDGIQHGLIVNPDESGSIVKWQITATTTNAIRSWDGVYNMGLMTDSPAKNYCTDLSTGGFTDWYLPSIDELSILWQNRFLVNNALHTGSYTLISNGSYWSSTERETDNTDAFAFYNQRGSPDYNNKTNNVRVRAIRAF